MIPTVLLVPGVLGSPTRVSVSREVRERSARGPQGLVRGPRGQREGAPGPSHHGVGISRYPGRVAFTNKRWGVPVSHGRPKGGNLRARELGTLKRGPAGGSC
eukprot:3781633-Rhodomonas_salina.1